MTPGKSLFTTQAFQLSVFVPTLVAGALGVWISHVEQLGFQLSSEGVKNLWEYHKLPLTTLGLLFPLTALVASHHRSLQSAEQISQQYEQNLLHNHFKHAEEFKKAWKDQDLENIRLRRKSLREIHSTIFPKTLSGDFSISPRFKSALENQVLQNLALASKVAAGQDTLFLEKNIEEIRNGFANYFGVKTPHLNNLKSQPCSSVQQFTSTNVNLLRDISEASSFLPPHSVREICKTCDEALKESNNLLTEGAEREQALEQLNRSIGSLIDSLGMGTETDASNYALLEPYMHEIIETDSFSLTEKIDWFPWEIVARKIDLLADLIPGKQTEWILAHSPRDIEVSLSTC